MPTSYGGGADGPPPLFFFSFLFFSLLLPGEALASPTATYVSISRQPQSQPIRLFLFFLFSQPNCKAVTFSGSTQPSPPPPCLTVYGGYAMGEPASDPREEKFKPVLGQTFFFFIFLLSPGVVAPALRGGNAWKRSLKLSFFFFSFSFRGPISTKDD